MLLQPRRGRPLRRPGGKPPPAAPHALQYPVEPESADQRAQQGRQDYDHVGVEARLACIGVAGHPDRIQGRVPDPGTRIQQPAAQTRGAHLPSSPPFSYDRQVSEFPSSELFKFRGNKR